MPIRGDWIVIKPSSISTNLCYIEKNNRDGEKFPRIGRSGWKAGPWGAG
jgi:hypothetical protein